MAYQLFRTNPFPKTMMFSVNWNFGNRIQWILTKNATIWIQQHRLKYIVWKITFFLSASLYWIRHIYLFNLASQQTTCLIGLGQWQAYSTQDWLDLWTLYVVVMELSIQTCHIINWSTLRKIFKNHFAFNSWRSDIECLLWFQCQKYVNTGHHYNWT